MELGNEMSIIENGEQQLSVDNFFPKNNYHPLLGHYYYNSRRRFFLWLFWVALLGLLLGFLLSFAFYSSRPLSVSLSLAGNNGTTLTNSVQGNADYTGKTALSENQLKTVAQKIGGTFFWVGAQNGAKYTFNHNAPGQDFIRYLPSGLGLADTNQNYRVIATYKVANAYSILSQASKQPNSVGLTNPDGSFVYYSKSTPTHVYVALKGKDYQIEIFDPISGAALKLATTPGSLVSLL